jgi:hypothetical protein
MFPNAYKQGKVGRSWRFQEPIYIANRKCNFTLNFGVEQRDTTEFIVKTLVKRIWVLINTNSPIPRPSSDKAEVDIDSWLRVYLFYFSDQS